MNTPAHGVLNLLLLARRERQVSWVAAGALLPDVPAVLFYAWEKLVLGKPEAVIWAQDYFLPGWQDLFDSFHSIPILGAAALVAFLAGAPRLALLLASMVLHAVADLPLHGEDGHRHFHPLSDWRFESPVSYWDPSRFGQLAGWLELALVAVGTVVLWKRHPAAWPRGVAVALAAGYAAYIGYVFAVWV